MLQRAYSQMLVVKAIFSGLIGASLYAALLLIPAGLVPDGTWIWPRGIALSVALCLLSVAGTVALAIINPASYRVRLQGPLAQRHARQPLADIVITGLLSISVLLWLILIPLDVFYLRLLPRPSAAISGAGAVAAIIGFLVMSLAIVQNEFAAPNVQLQSEQRVISTGLYCVVRHPLYTGGLIMFSGWALWLESYAALIALAGVLLLVFARIAVEEAFLRKNLPDYADYAKRVRSRLIPFLI